LHDPNGSRDNDIWLDNRLVEAFIMRKYLLNRLEGYGSWIQALISAVLFGISTPISKILLHDFHPFLLASLFYLGAAIILLPLSLYYQAKSPLNQLSRSDSVNLAGSLFFGGMVGPVLLLYGLRYTAATNASLLLNLETPATTLLAFWLFKENISRKATLANAGIVLAGAILSFQGLSHPDFGGILIAAACIAWGLDNNHTASIHNLDAVRCTFLKGMIFGSVNFLIATQLVETWPGANQIIFALLIGAFSYGISIVLYIAAARQMGAARSQMVFASAPFFGVAVSQFYLAENFHLYQLMSMLILIGMLWLLLTEMHLHGHEHAPIRHNHPHAHDDDHHDHDHVKRISDPRRPHAHLHFHERMFHRHGHLPDLHHRHDH
jgi:drug/metabolite transporter (DMT)-like permease